MEWEEEKREMRGEGIEERGQRMNPRCGNTLKQPRINRRVEKLDALRVITKIISVLLGLLSLGIFAMSLPWRQ